MDDRDPVPAAKTENPVRAASIADGGLSPPLAWEATMRILILAMTLISSSAVAQSANWQRYTAAMGAGSSLSVDVPAGIFTVDKGATPAGTGRTFVTADGRADLSIYSIDHPSARPPSAFVRQNFNVPDGVSVTYRRVTGRIVALSGYRGNTIWYTRCNVSRGNAKCVGLNYPRQEKLRWDPVVTRISNSLS